jgi:hypothetical protein
MLSNIYKAKCFLWRQKKSGGKLLPHSDLWIFRKWEGVVGTGWSWLRIGTVGGQL